MVEARPAAVVPLFFILAAVPTGPVLGQEDGCRDRPSLQVTVVDESGNIPIPGATLVVHWSDVEEMALRETAGAEGLLLLCAPAEATEAVLWAELGDASSTERLVVIVPGSRHDVELRLLLDDVETGRLVGQVLDGRTHRPVAAAEVSVPDRAAVVTSNRMGRFVLSGVPVGSHELSVRHIGYAPLTHAVSVRPGITTEVEIGLSTDPVELAPLVVTVERPRRLEIKGFYERKHWGELLGLGTFITEEDIERWRPLRVSDLVSMLVPSVAPGMLNRRGSSGLNRTCRMAVYLDGFAVGRNLDLYVKPIEVGGIEVYKGLASTPAEFASRCGAVVVWTK
ncbi:MAG: carboxypeptidase regulatory-like domain-containing protein [Gemmatimonadota bacterium]|uniref:carboxypeptidase regulatory-like domain-containing protein n=1 Tax=Candidatus Palauibacter scopulicola TaxID=3056741 RepID=UPI00239B4B47|nr:carboxypeptidase regulatory-like domain-containing protein [Candidatus Palauibacter scopulicola]MDE2661493.1 carboxypeptidase regulatory-like domain-containing protein [Candidatus Palauibacter scopulicola]